MTPSKYLSLLVLGLLTACDVPKQMAKDCGGDMEQGCKMVFGNVEAEEEHEQSQNAAIQEHSQQLTQLQSLFQVQLDSIDAVQSQLEALRSAISVLNSANESLNSQISNLVADYQVLLASDSAQTAAIQALQSQIELLQTAVSQNTTQILALNTVSNTHTTQITNIQGQINYLLTQIAQTATGDRVVDYLDCNLDGPGYDEVVLRMSSGKLLAYMEDTGQRFLTLLAPGNYKTTDKEKCAFTVNAQMQFCDSLGCR